MEDRGGEEGYARFILIVYRFSEGGGVRIPTLECTLFYIYLNRLCWWQQTEFSLCLGRFNSFQSLTDLIRLVLRCKQVKSF